MEVEYIPLVDEKDNVIGKVTREEMREKNLLHRGIAVIVFNKKGEIIIHKRPKDKLIYPDCYSVAFGGAVKYGETYEEAAKRELKEEAGIETNNLKFCLYELFDTDEDRCFIKVYTYVNEGLFEFNDKEVLEPRFVTLEELEKLIKTEKFAPDDIYLFGKCMEKKK